MGAIIRDRYEPIRVLGSGAQGEVVLATDRRHGRLVAIKVRRAGDDEERDSVLREARALLDCGQHPGLPALREDFFEDGAYHLVTDFVDGESLAGALEDRGSPGLPYDTVLAWIARAADALEHLHRRGIVHQDVKPANLIVTPDGSVVLVDLGVARRASDTAIVGGTRGFAAPEIARGGEVGPPADVYGLAATAFALLTGSPPAGTDPDLSSVPREAVASVERALRLALSPDPSRRPATPSELVARLRALDRPLPEGVVTFLFTDVEGSTQLWERDATAMREALRRHDEIIRTAVEDAGGQLVKARGEGDSHFGVFVSPVAAITGAVAAQFALQREPWRVEISVRMGLHTGEADVRDGGYYGAEVNRTARLRSAAWGGQILVSETTADLVRARLPDGVRLSDAGVVPLAGLSHPEHVAQVVHPQLRASFPPLRAAETPSGNLPTVAASLIGRGREIDEIGAIVASGAQLVTLTGPAGVGKTRLALEVASAVADRFPGGIWVVDLAELTDAGAIAPAIASALHVREQPGRSLEETLADVLDSPDIGLLLDSFDHLVEAATMLTRLGRARLIVTSRQSLHLRGEREYPVRELALPDAVALFEHCAQGVKPGFVVDDENRADVERVCERLDRLPLAIELAAPRVKLLAPRAIADRLSDALRLLTGGARDLPERQRTIRGAIGWSYELLSPEEQAALRRLSVYAGGFDLEMAEDMVGPDAIDLVTSLLDKSFVRADDDRFGMLTTVRAYCGELLASAGEVDDAYEALASTILRLVLALAADMHGPGQRAVLDRLDLERENIRSAFEWLRSSGRPEEALQLAVACAEPWRTRGRLSEARERLEAVVDAGTGELRVRALLAIVVLAVELGDLAAAAECARAMPPDRADVLNALGAVARASGDPDGAVELCSQAREGGDDVAVATAEGTLAWVAFDRGDFAGAGTHAEEALRLRAKLGDAMGRATALNLVGLIAHRRNDLDRAEESFERSLAISRDLGDRLAVAHAVNNLGRLAKQRGDLARAQACFEDAMQAFREVGAASFEIRALNNLATVASEQGFLGTARGRFERAAMIARRIGDRPTLAMNLANTGGVLLEMGEHAEAERVTTEAIGIAEAVQHLPEVAFMLVVLGAARRALDDLAGARGALERALRIASELDLDVELMDASYELGLLDRLEGRDDEAVDRLRTAQAIARRIGDEARSAQCDELLGT